MSNIFDNIILYKKEKFDKIMKKVVGIIFELVSNQH